MNTPPNQLPEEFIAEADVSRGGGISIIWLIPLVALAIGGWLVYKAYTEKGPTITIHFDEAAGVIAGKTVVRYRDVEIGKVGSVSLNKDLTGVTVTADLDKGTARLLGENTRFWVAQPEISITGVRGLQTILSGVFIGVDPDTDGAARREFIGLDETPFITGAQGGRYFILDSPNRGSLNRGAPVLYRGFKVGEIVNYNLVEDGSRVEVRVFIEAPHYERISEQTRFWNVSGVDVELSADGVKVNSKSLVSILIGGLTFGNPADGPKGETAAEETQFTLFADREEAFRPTYTRRRVIIYFDQSVRGLTVGAPLEFRGAKMGEVVDIRAQFYTEGLIFRIPVFVDIEPERFEIVGTVAQSQDKRSANLQELVDRGLRAQLKTGSLLTGQKLIELDFYPDAEPVEVAYEGAYPIIPTIPTVLDTVTQKITGILEKLDRLPIEEISEDLRGTMSRVRQLVEEAEVQSAIDALAGALSEAEELAMRLNTDVVPPVAATLQQTEQFTKNLNTELAPQIDEVLRELKDAARSIRVMADYLERHPDALIKGKK